MNVIEYETYREKKDHGDFLFPFNIYPCCIPGDFPTVPLHWHDEIELIYVKKGGGSVTIDLVSHTVKSGDIVLVLPGHLHSIHTPRNGSMDYENIIFQLDLLSSPGADVCTTQFFGPLANGQISIPSLIVPKDPLYPFIASCLNELDRICHDPVPSYPLGVKSILFQVFFLLFSQKDVISSVREPRKSMEHIKATIKYIELHYAERITIEQMADVLHLSASHFMRFFKATMGVPFIRYLNDYRLAMASRQLTTSNDSILSIASRCGFENLSLFNRLFKKEYGMTPREYRKQYQK